MKNIAIFFFLLWSSLLIAQSDSLDFTAQIEAHRANYKADFLKHDYAPLDSADIPNLRFYEADENYQVLATFTRTENAEEFEMATYSGITKPYVKYGELHFELNGETVQLAVYQSIKLRQMPQYREYLFIPFKDASNDETSYGGGRYIDISISDILEDKVVIDFNKAYNPYCAYSDGYNCPVPPRENWLEISIEAGEQLYVGKKKHRTKKDK